MSKMSTVERCCICQERTKSETTVENTYIGSPPILIKDLLLICFESPERLQKVISEKIQNNYLCEICEASLGEFYDVVLEVSSKRARFLNRILGKSDIAADYFVITESTEKRPALLNESIKHINTDKLELYISQDEDIDLSKNASDEEFVKVNQPREDFEDDWSSDCTNDFEDADEERKPMITIERMPKTKLRFCWRCDKNFPSDDIFEIHLKQVHTKKKKRNLSSRKIQKHSTSKKSSVYDSRERNSIMCRCEICTVEFDSSTDFQLHMNAPKERNFSQAASTCRRILPKCVDKSHISAYVRNFACPVCDFKFRTAWNLKRHQKLHCLGDIRRKSGATFKCAY